MMVVFSSQVLQAFQPPSTPASCRQAIVVVVVVCLLVEHLSLFCRPRLPPQIVSAVEAQRHNRAQRDHLREAPSPTRLHRNRRLARHSQTSPHDHSSLPLGRYAASHRPTSAKAAHPHPPATSRLHPAATSPQRPLKSPAHSNRAPQSS